MFSRKAKLLKKKISKFPSKNGKKKKNLKPLPTENQEEIASVSSDLENDPNIENAPSIHSDSETIDEKRLRLAKKLIQEAKTAHNIENDDFFLEKTPFQGVYREDEEEDLVTKALQKELLIKSGMVYSEMAETLKAKYKDKPSFSFDIFKGHTKCITALKIDAVRNIMYSVSKDASLIKWDLEKNAKTIISYGKEKDKKGHYDQILGLDLSYDGKFLVTVGQDQMIKIWDPISHNLIETLKGHRDSITGVKFQKNSHVFCTISNDRTFKMWDAAEKSYMDTFYGHTSHINGIDSMNISDFVTCGFDKHAIYWKIDKASQLIFQGHHNYSVDCIKSLSNETFVTGGQDSTLALWSMKRKKPIFEMQNLHDGNWLTCLGGEPNSDVFFSGSSNGVVNVYGVTEKRNKFEKFLEIPTEGIVNDIGVLRKNDGYLVAVAEGEEHRLGRWITKKAKNRIKIYNLSC